MNLEDKVPTGRAVMNRFFFLRYSDTGGISWYKSFGNQQSCVNSMSNLTYLSHLTLNQIVFPAKKYVFKYKTPLPLSICLVVSGTDPALRQKDIVKRSLLNWSYSA